ncbi:hypothetical protein NQ315_016594 [Exocentrus adspersus]|uniref:Uncharacterized protein n=1 Tax=Exocentrus adspersus TaxID=1586481 RepID=A0AAV8V9Z3_9CUCU|nr:hypothetical protein NQ315_016594 [Exocentrus adspersus]
MFCILLIDRTFQSEHDSLDENVIGCEESTHSIEQIQQTPHIPRNQNLYQTLPVPPNRKLETTEL